MKIFWTFIAEIAIAILSFGWVWVVSDFGWEPFLVFIPALCGLFLTGSQLHNELSGSRGSNYVHPHDKILFDKLLRMLPANDVIEWIRQNNFAGFSFDRSRLDPIRVFVNEWDNPEHEFIDVDIEHARTQLFESLENFMSTIATETFAMDNGSQSVPPDWERNDAERFKEVVSRLHGQAQEIVDRHARIVRLGRRRLESHR
jgi:hypothetical protein